MIRFVRIRLNVGFSYFLSDDWHEEVNPSWFLLMTISY